MYKALRIAITAHNGQLRNYNNGPYVLHPIAVAEIVNSVTLNKKMLEAALLHDTVEDTDVTFEFLSEQFSIRTVQLVKELTDVSKPEDGNRAVRKQIDLEHTAQASPDGKTIKLADLIHNTSSVLKYDPSFAKIYMKEKKALLEVLTQGNNELWARAYAIVENYYA